MQNRPRSWTHGPSFEEGGVRFRLWAPGHDSVELALEGGERLKMDRGEGGFYECLVPGLRAGQRYRFALPDGRLVPDPASRRQPLDVDGPSELVAPDAHDWRCAWGGIAWDDVVLYELHLGAFSPEGDFAGAVKRLPHLRDLGVTAVEIMPVADFPGGRGWGYDGVFPYAPDAAYGRPEDFKAFVDAAHGHGIAVLLDVVYNHFGPQGNYLPLIAPAFFTARHRTPWGDAIDFGSIPVRDFFLENAEYWIDEFRLDGLRFDAVHAIRDDSRPDILQEIAERLRARFDRPLHLLLEHEDNEPERLERSGRNPVQYTAQWNDDVHHVLHVAATGEQSGYYSAYGDTQLLLRALAEGFAYQGEFMPYREGPRGAPSGHLPPDAFVGFIQNHDQIGNRAFGERLSKLASEPAQRALAGVYLLSPEIPMLFMGEEWGETRPFLFFCDFQGDLAEAVRNGRRAEFARFPEFSHPEKVKRIPDPLAEETFLACKLDWDHVNADRLLLYRELIRTRRRFVRPLLRSIERGGDGQVIGASAVRLVWRAGGRRLVLDANLADRRSAFPQLVGEAFWNCGETQSEFGPWSVRWSLA